MHHSPRRVFTHTMFALATALMAVSAHAVQFTPSVAPLSVYPECVAPKPVVGAKTYYVDPVKGSSAGDGSAARPWQSLAAVINGKVATSVYKAPFIGTDGKVANNYARLPLNASAPIKGGDTILLMNGDHGTVAVKGVNEQFITIKAAPGQSPLLRQISFAGAAKWILQGVKVQKESTGFSNLISVSLHGFIGPVDNIIIDGNTASSTDDVSGWSQADWRERRAYRGVMVDGGVDAQYANCIAVTNNKLLNLQYGAGLSGSKSLFAGNLVDTFGGDGLDIAGNHQLITRNYITNAVNMGNGDHPDAIQGQLGRGTHWKNVTIDRNLVVRQSNPNLRFANDLQGISAFDNDWSNVTLTNNIVISNAVHGITWGSLHGGLVANNTVINDGTAANKIASITLGGKTHRGAPANDVVVRNNITTLLSIDYGAKNIVADRNLASQFNYTVAGRATFQRTPGVYFDNTVIPAADFYRQFTRYDPSALVYDVTLAGNSMAINSGNALLAPKIDFFGANRVAAVDLGAVESRLNAASTPVGVITSIQEKR